MAKNVKRYLVSHWCSARGTSKEKPAYYIGPESYIITDLSEADPEKCYKTEAAALRMCAKLCTAYWWAAVVEISNNK